MRIKNYLIMALTICALVVSTSAIGAERPRWGYNVGYKFAKVVSPDSDKGLTVRQAPGKNNEALAYITKGTPLELHSEYENGWARLKKPFGRGWVDMSRLETMKAPARITKSLEGRDCAPLRNGPAGSFKELNCVKVGERVSLDGTWTSSDWALVAEPAKGWIDTRLIKSETKMLFPQDAGKKAEVSQKAGSPTKKRKRNGAGYQSEVERLMNEPLFDPESDKKLQQFLIEEADRRMEMDLRNFP